MNGFTDRWIDYFQSKGIAIRIVDCYRSDILEQLADCSGLMWHWTQYDFKAQLLARQLTCALEASGKKVFPNFRTCWHFDDKVGQKYLLEAVKAPLVKSYVFYDKKEASQWLDTISFPVVFKLKGGAGSINVQLVDSKRKAHNLITKAFNKGFPKINRFSLLKDRFWHYKRDKNVSAFLGILKGLARLFTPTDYEKSSGLEKGYVYFQEYVPGNDCDIRVITIGNKAVAIKRMVRNGDFRASGSGTILYDPDQINPECIQIAFEVSSKLKAQCLAYDFIKSKSGFKIVEISYAFSTKAYDYCPGHWNSDLVWQNEPINLQHVMASNFVDELIGSDICRA